MTSKIKLLRLALLLVLCARPAVATAAADSPADRSDDSVEGIVTRAQAAAGVRNFELAASLWQAAYERQPNPEFLFYLGEACRQLPGPAMTSLALRAYRRYLQEEAQPAAALQARAREAIAELSQRRATAHAEKAKAPIEGVASLPAAALPPRQVPAQALSMTLPAPLVRSGRPARPRRRPRLAGAILLGAGVLLGATGSILLGASIQGANQARQAENLAAYEDQRGGALGLLGGGVGCVSAAGLLLAGGTFFFVRAR